MMIRSMSAIRARVAELKAFVDKREVRDNRRLGGQGNRGPVVVARRPEVVSLHAPSGISAKPMVRLTHRRLDGPDSDPPPRQQLGEADLQRPRLESSDELADEP